MAYHLVLPKGFITRKTFFEGSSVVRANIFTVKCVALVAGASFSQVLQGS